MVIGAGENTYVANVFEDGLSPPLLPRSVCVEARVSFENFAGASLSLSCVTFQYDLSVSFTSSSAAAVRGHRSVAAKSAERGKEQKQKQKSELPRKSISKVGDK